MIPKRVKSKMKTSAVAAQKLNGGKPASGKEIVRFKTEQVRFLHMP